MYGTVKPEKKPAGEFQRARKAMNDEGRGMMEVRAVELGRDRQTSLAQPDRTVSNSE